MKPCPKYKEQIALAVVEGELSGELKQHIKDCVACRKYAEDMGQVYSDLSRRAAALPEIEAPARLHARVRDSITRNKDAVCCGVEVSASLRRLLQGLGVAATAAIILAVVLQLAPRKPPAAAVTVEVTKPEVPPIAEPTFAAYHNRLARSVEEFEASLKDHGALNGGEVLKVSSASENLP